MTTINSSDINLKTAFKEFHNRKKIKDQFSEKSLMCLHEAFLVTENEAMDMSMLRNAFEHILKMQLSNHDFQILFKKINIKKDGYVTWDEFISYLLLEFREKDTSLQWQTLELPLTDYPVIIKTHHRTPICKIVFYPEVLADRSTSFQRGCFLTASKDGTINYWSLDFKYERSVKSTNPYLKVQPTIITDMIAMPDIQVICTSSYEFDLRFYDIVANKFDLRVLISSLKDAVVCMTYYFHQNIKEDSYIILGDTSGSIKIMTFNPIERGPFKHRSDSEPIIISYNAVTKGELIGLKVVEIKNVHTNWVNQVAYYESLRGFISSSRCSSCSLLLSDPAGTKMKYKFNILMGISCFDYCEENQMLVTGSPDCIIRTWNPFVPNKANNIFHGHRASICAIIIQNAGKRIYSLSSDKCIKVWDVSAEFCIQTYNGLQMELNEYIPVAVMYNKLTHKMIVASSIIAILVCDQVVNPEATDGYTHTKPVSCVLYNNLFQLIVSTGLDSCIIVWDPWVGRRVYLVTNAHSNKLYGEYINIEITTATLDDSEQLLLTGAQDGSLKIWNFNTGTCLKKMAIEEQCEITSLIWIDNRILCTGSNRRVTEFATSEYQIYTKNWEIRHTDDILFCTAYYPQTVVTASYNGELCLWRLETGQPYRKYLVSNATKRYTMVYKKDYKKVLPTSIPAIRKVPIQRNIRKSGNAGICSTHQQSALNITRLVSICAILFLTARETNLNVGTLLVSIESGLIQVWSHHPGGGFLTAFSIIHTVRDCGTSLATDPKNRYLVTGHKTGYIKVWYLENFMVLNPPKPCMPLLRLEFPFLWKDRINGRAKRAVRDQPLPLLLSSLRGHTKAITCLQIIPSTRIILSGSVDHTVRLWTLGGRYISTLGTFREWKLILPTVPAFKYFDHYRLPKDIEKSASFTTLKVLRGGLGQLHISVAMDELKYPKEIAENERSVLYGKRLTDPILGNYYRIC